MNTLLFAKMWNFNIFVETYIIYEKSPYVYILMSLYVCTYANMKPEIYV